MPPPERLWLFFSSFLFPPKKKDGEEKENELSKIVIKIHAFQTGQTNLFDLITQFY